MVGWSRVEMKEEAFWHSRSSHQWMVGGGAMPGGGAFVFVFLYLFFFCICIPWQLYFHLLHFLNLYFWHSLTLPSGVYVLVSTHFLFRGDDLVSSGRGGGGGFLLSGFPIHLLFFLKVWLVPWMGHYCPEVMGLWKAVVVGISYICSCLDLFSISEKGLLSRWYIFAFSNACLGWFPGGC